MYILLYLFYSLS